MLNVIYAVLVDFTQPVGKFHWLINKSTDQMLSSGNQKETIVIDVFYVWIDGTRSVLL